jgi:hypothetical protein
MKRTNYLFFICFIALGACSSKEQFTQGKTETPKLVEPSQKWKEFKGQGFTINIPEPIYNFTVEGPNLLMIKNFNFNDPNLDESSIFKLDIHLNSDAIESFEKEKQKAENAGDKIEIITINGRNALKTKGKSDLDGSDGLVVYYWEGNKSAIFACSYNINYSFIEDMIKSFRFTHA